MQPHDAHEPRESVRLMLSASPLDFGSIGVGPSATPAGLQKRQYTATVCPSGMYEPCSHFAIISHSIGACDCHAPRLYYGDNRNIARHCWKGKSHHHARAILARAFLLCPAHPMGAGLLHNGNMSC